MYTKYGRYFLDTYYICMNQSTKNILYAVIGLCVVLSAFLYISYEHKQADTLRIGVILPATGKFADISEDVLNAIHLAAEKYPTIQLDEEDSAGEAPKALSALANLIHVKKSMVILSGPGGSTSNIAMAPTANKESVPLVAISSSAQIREKDDYVFTTYPFIGSEMRAMAEHLMNEGIKTVAITFDMSSDTQIAGVEIFTKAYTSLGGKVLLSEGYNKDIEYRTIVTKLLGENPETVFVLASDKISASFVKQIREQSYAGRVVGISTAEGETFLTAAGTYANGFEITAVPFSCDRTEYTKDYCLQYKTKFNREPTPFGAYAYDSLHLIATAHAGCKGKKEFKQCLVDTTLSQTLTESFVLDSNGDLVDKAPIHIKKVVNGKFVQVK